MDNPRTEEIMREVGQYMNSDVGFLDALTHYAEKHDIEMEVLGEVVRKSNILMTKAIAEAESLRLIPRQPRRLPI